MFILPFLHIFLSWFFQNKEFGGKYVFLLPLFTYILFPTLYKKEFLASVLLPGFSRTNYHHRLGGIKQQKGILWSFGEQEYKISVLAESQTLWTLEGKFLFFPSLSSFWWLLTTFALPWLVERGVTSVPLCVMCLYVSVLFFISIRKPLTRFSAYTNLAWLHLN